MADTRRSEVKDWNKNHPPGTKVRYWLGPRDGIPPRVGRTTHPARLLSGHTPVVWIDTATGCVALSHVEEDRG